MRGKSLSRKLPPKQDKKVQQVQEDEDITFLRTQLAQLKIRKNNLQKEIVNLEKHNESRKGMNANMTKTYTALEKQLKILKNRSANEQEKYIKIQTQPNNPFPIQKISLQSTPQIIKGCEIVKYSKSGTTEICMACFQQLRQNVSCKKLPCEHLMHLDCAEQYFSVETICPNCGYKLK